MINYRSPQASEGKILWELTDATKKLDLNSPYAYMLIGEHFAETSAVAVDGDKVVGFASGYIPPAKPDTLFVWQVGVNSDYRGQGIAGKLLNHMLSQPACNNIQFIETTITPDNVASRKLFQRLADTLGCAINETENYFPAEFFPGAGNEGHLAESLFRLGPFKA
jgi:L-2,4-diaminobutyric acid acetyltransferase